MRRPPDPRRAAAPAKIAEAGELTGVGADSPTSIPLGGSGASDLAPVGGIVEHDDDHVAALR